MDALEEGLADGGQVEAFHIPIPLISDTLIVTKAFSVPSNHNIIFQRRSISFDEDSPDYYEIDDIAPLPLYSLIAADVDCNIGLGEKAESFGRVRQLFSNLFLFVLDYV